MEMTHVLRFLQLLCENHNIQLQNYLRKQLTAPAALNKNSYNLINETLELIESLCGGTTGGLGLLGLYINEGNFELVDQCLCTLTEFCQGPCPENQVYLDVHCCCNMTYIGVMYIGVMTYIIGVKKSEVF